MFAHAQEVIISRQIHEWFFMSTKKKPNMLHGLLVTSPKDNWILMRFSGEQSVKWKAIPATA